MFGPFADSPRSRTDRASRPKGLYRRSSLAIEKLEDRRVLSVDMVSQATPVEVETSVSGNISSGTDVDLYAVTVEAGQEIVFDIDFLEGGLDSYIRLFDASGALLASNDNGNGEGGAYPEFSSLESFLDFTFTTAGTYYLGVSSSGNESYDPLTGGGAEGATAGAYLLNVDRGIARDDQTWEATEMTIGAAVAGSISFGHDVDLYRINAPAGMQVRIQLEIPGGGFDSRIRVLDSNYNEVASGDSALEFISTSDGSYYIGVSHSANRSYGIWYGRGDVEGTGAGDYTLTVASNGFLSNDDTISQAMPPYLGGWVVGSISHDTDVDMYFINVPAMQRHVIEVETIGYDASIRLFDSSGALVASNENGEPLDVTFITGGRYYIGVSADGNNAYDPLTGEGRTAGIGTGWYRLSTPRQDLEEGESELVVGNTGTGEDPSTPSPVPEPAPAPLPTPEAADPPPGEQAVGTPIPETPIPPATDAPPTPASPGEPSAVGDAPAEAAVSDGPLPSDLPPVADVSVTDEDPQSDAEAISIDRGTDQVITVAPTPLADKVNVRWAIAGWTQNSLSLSRSVQISSSGLETLDAESQGDDPITLPLRHRFRARLALDRAFAQWR
ncbi:MAG: DVUA0089 family protein [Planctomycetes bacterium]|nr:DVUA0089 family protein [Planctomycetota bacterium]